MEYSTKKPLTPYINTARTVNVVAMEQIYPPNNAIAAYSEKKTCSGRVRCAPRRNHQELCDVVVRRNVF
jgi:hypothetical protein